MKENKNKVINSINLSIISLITSIIYIAFQNEFMKELPHIKHNTITGSLISLLISIITGSISIYLGVKERNKIGKIIGIIALILSGFTFYVMFIIFRPF